MSDKDSFWETYFPAHKKTQLLTAAGKLIGQDNEDSKRMAKLIDKRRELEFKYSADKLYKFATHYHKETRSPYHSYLEVADVEDQIERFIADFKPTNKKRTRRYFESDSSSTDTDGEDEHKRHKKTSSYKRGSYNYDSDEEERKFRKKTSSYKKGGRKGSH
jgi:hypothetical protein